MVDIEMQQAEEKDKGNSTCRILIIRRLAKWQQNTRPDEKSDEGDEIEKQNETQSETQTGADENRETQTDAHAHFETQADADQTHTLRHSHIDRCR